MIGWLVALTLYAIGCVWMLRTIYECSALPVKDGASIGSWVLALWPAFLWPAYVVLCETCMFFGGDDDDE